MQNINSISLFDFLKKFGNKDLSELGWSIDVRRAIGGFPTFKGYENNRVIIK